MRAWEVLVQSAEGVCVHVAFPKFCASAITPAPYQLRAKGSDIGMNAMLARPKRRRNADKWHHPRLTNNIAYFEGNINIS